MFVTFTFSEMVLFLKWTTKYWTFICHHDIMWQTPKTNAWHKNERLRSKLRHRDLAKQAGNNTYLNLVFS